MVYQFVVWLEHEIYISGANWPATKDMRELAKDHILHSKLSSHGSLPNGLNERDQCLPDFEGGP